MPAADLENGPPPAIPPSGSTSDSDTPVAEGKTRGGPDNDASASTSLSASSPSGRRDWRAQLGAEVDLRWTDLPLFVCCVISGLCDSVTVNAAGTFVSMQTGNTVFLALGAAGLPAGDSFLWLRSLISISSFALGCFCFGQLRRIAPRRKTTLALSFIIQAAAIYLAAALAQTGVVPDFARTSVPGFDSPDDFVPSSGQISVLPVAIIAWQFGGQIVSSRVLGYGEVPTCVLTSVYCDLFSDPKMLAPLGENIKRNRRALAISLLLIGGIIGGWLQRSPAGMTGVLWLAGSLKVFIAVAWLLWPSKKVEEKSA